MLVTISANHIQNRAKLIDLWQFMFEKVGSNGKKNDNFVPTFSKFQNKLDYDLIKRYSIQLRILLPTYMQNFSLINWFWSEILVEIWNLVYIFNPSATVDRKTKGCTSSRNRFQIFLQFWVIWVYIHHICRPEKNLRWWYFLGLV